jgi:hypothetical protein
MSKWWRLAIVAFLSGPSPETSAASLTIPLASRAYGFIGEESMDAQSFLAPDRLLVSASMPLRSQPGAESVSQIWEFVLWDDDAGRPGTVLARFGAFDPGGVGSVAGNPAFGVGFESSLGAPLEPIELTPRNRYYLGISPEGGPRYDRGDAIFALGDGGCDDGCSGVDLYTEGAVWAIRLQQQGTAPLLIVEQPFDFSMSIVFVPEPSSLSLTSLGLVVFALMRRRSVS